MEVVEGLYKKLGKEETFLEKIEMVLKSSFPKMAAVVLTREITMYYYLFSSKSKGEVGESFTYHKGVGFKGILITLLCVILLESIGLFFLIHSWSPLLSWIHIALNLYGLLYLISDYRAIVQLPIMVNEQEVYIRIGTRRKIKFPFNKIASIHEGSRFAEQRKNKNVFKAILIEFDTPQYELNLKEPITITNFFGKPQEITTIYITVDDKVKFHQLLLERLAK